MRLAVKGIIFEDFVNYKKPSMVIEMPFCTFKCDKQCGRPVCQNSSLAQQENHYVDVDQVMAWYIGKNKIAESIVFQGLEPFDSFTDLRTWITTFRHFTDDDIVIYTGYNKDELTWMLEELSKFKNIIIKYGRFIPNQESHYDPVLGVELSSPNQYAEVFS